MAFETCFMEDKERYSVCDKFKLKNYPFRVYRYEKINDVYLFLRFGIDMDHPGKIYLVWDNQTCRMNAYPTEPMNVLNTDNPESIFIVTDIYVPSDFNKDREQLVDLLEEAFNNFEVDLPRGHYIFKIDIKREQLINNIHYDNIKE